MAVGDALMQRDRTDRDVGTGQDPVALRDRGVVDDGAVDDDGGGRAGALGDPDGLVDGSEVGSGGLDGDEDVVGEEVATVKASPPECGAVSITRSVAPSGAIRSSSRSRRLA